MIANLLLTIIRSWDWIWFSHEFFGFSIDEEDMIDVAMTKVWIVAKFWLLNWWLMGSMKTSLGKIVAAILFIDNVEHVNLHLCIEYFCKFEALASHTRSTLFIKCVNNNKLGVQYCYEFKLILMITTKILIFELGIIIELWFKFIVVFFKKFSHNLSTNQVDEDLGTIQHANLSLVTIWLQN